MFSFRTFGFALDLNLVDPLPVAALASGNPTPFTSPPLLSFACHMPLMRTPFSFVSDRFSAAPGVCCEPGPMPGATAKSEVTHCGGRAGIADRGGRAGPGLDITLSTLWAATRPGSRAARRCGHRSRTCRTQTEATGFPDSEFRHQPDSYSTVTVT